MSVGAHLEGMALMGWAEALARYERLWVSYLDAQDRRNATKVGTERDDATVAMSDAQEWAEAVLSFSLQQMTPPDKAGELMLAALVERHFGGDDTPAS